MIQIWKSVQRCCISYQWKSGKCDWNCDWCPFVDVITSGSIIGCQRFQVNFESQKRVTLFEQFWNNLSEVQWKFWIVYQNLMIYLKFMITLTIHNIIILLITVQQHFHRYTMSNVLASSLSLIINQFSGVPVITPELFTQQSVMNTFRANDTKIRLFCS